MSRYPRNTARPAQESQNPYYMYPGTSTAPYMPHMYAYNQYYVPQPPQPAHGVHYSPEPQHGESSRSNARPRRRDRSQPRLKTPSELLQPFDRRTGTGILWDMRFNPGTARRPGEGRRGVVRAHLQRAATEPETKKLRITLSTRPEWEIEVSYNSNNNNNNEYQYGQEQEPERGFFSVEDVLASISRYMLQPITLQEWEGLPPERQKQVHLLRHDRLADDVVEFEVDSSVRWVDLLGWKTVFAGITPLGPSEWEMEVLDRRRVPELMKKED